MLENALLGVIQGITEWLPVSSEGAVTAAGSFFLNMEVEEALAQSLWLHLGTSVAAAVVFRRELVRLAREALRDPAHPSPLLKFLVLASAVSAVVGLPLLIVLEEISAAVGSGAMMAIGAFMLLTGVVQLLRPAHGLRGRDHLQTRDAVAAGIAQGLAVLPGLSRSGLTVAVLLGRRVDRSEALALSFLMSIPAGLAAALLAGLGTGTLRTANGIVGAAVAMAVGLVSIRALLVVARRLNFAVFVLLVGLATIGGAGWQMLVS